MKKSTESRPHPSYGTEHITVWQPDGDPKSTIILIHGIAEHAGRYERTGTLLAESGHRVVAPDLFGFGRSGGERAYVEDWADYRSQVSSLVDEARFSGLPVVLMGHSMGGLVVSDYVLTEGTPRPDLVVLSAPALEGGAWWQRLVAPVVAAIAPKAQIPNSLDGAHLSRDPEVAEAYFADPLVHTSSSPRLGAGMFRAQDRVKEGLHRWSLPTLVLHGGADRIVPARSTAPMEDLPSVDRKLYPKLRHEVLNEPEGPELVAEIVEWLDAHLPAHPGSVPEDQDLS